jgi:hypothetical protein
LGLIWAVTITHPPKYLPGDKQLPGANTIESLYDKYAGAIYGCIRYATDPDIGLAGNLLREVFIEYHQKNGGNDVQDKSSYTGLLKILIRVMEKNGFHICSSVTSGRLSFTRQTE